MEQEYTDNSEAINNIETEHIEQDNNIKKMIHVQNMFENWFLDYASYTILDRAVPYIHDGLKPVQRRILHSMRELDDGRYNKVANIIGNTMRYHPHGDASIGEAIVNMGQKDLLIDCQGNWGNILTGDGAAAPRYIEARLSKFALEVVFNPKTTQWQLSYDSRSKEPISLPVKFPLLLAQGSKGIGVGLSTEILPHNFNELIDASIAVLQNNDFTLYPDFPTGGYIDVNKYADGARGGRISVRAKIEQIDKKTLVITEIPYGITTEMLIESIESATEKGRISIKKIFDRTAEKVEIVLQLAPNASPDQTIDALYAFTKCQNPISPNACVIEDNKPIFTNVKHILRANTYNTMNLLKRELEIWLDELNDEWHWISLEKIFFEKRIYKELEKDSDSFDTQISNIEKAFDPYRKHFKKEITRDDVLKLCEKPVRKISKFDIKKAEEQINDIEANIEETNNHLNHLVDFTINYFKQIKKRFGEGRERKTEIRNFDNISVPTVAVANQKLYADREGGFIGYGQSLKKNEFICDCSDIDEIIAFKGDGTFMVTKIAEKKFVGKDIIYIDVFKRNDERTIYNMIYSNGKNGTAYAKRFAIGGISRDKDYLITQGKEGSKILHFTANKNGEAEIVRVALKPKPKLKKTVFDFDFCTLAIKGRSSMGNIVTKNPVRNVVLLKKGSSTLSDIEVWFDSSINRLNVDKHGESLGRFSANDKVIAFYKSGYYKITSFDVSVHFDDELLCVEKFKPTKPISAIYYDIVKKKYFIKRFLPEISTKKMEFVFEDQKQTLYMLSTNYLPQIEVLYYGRDKKDKHTELLCPAEYVEIMKIKAKGKRITVDNILSMSELEPIPYEEPEAEILDTESADIDEKNIDNTEMQSSLFDDEGFSSNGKQMELDI